jgi:hypothetical protein
MADKRTVTMTHPKAGAPIEVLPDTVPVMRERGWRAKGEHEKPAAPEPQKDTRKEGK